MKTFLKRLQKENIVLQSQIPVAKTDAVRNRIILKGEISSPIDPAPRLPLCFQMPVCKAGMLQDTAGIQRGGARALRGLPPV
jgi:hypothetical protein